MTLIIGAQGLYAYRKVRAMQLPTFSSRRLVAAGLFAATLLGVATAALAQPAATASSSGIALSRKVGHAFLHVPVLSYVQHGYIWMSAVEGKTPRFRVGPKAGFYPATEHALIALKNGRVSWSRDDLAPAPCRTPGTCLREPVQVAQTTVGGVNFYAVGNASKHTCYRKSSQPFPQLNVGAPFWAVSGHYQAPVASGRTETLTGTYPLSTTQVATEVDTIAKGSYRLLGDRVTVPARPGAPDAFSSSETFGYPSSVPPPPQINLCG